MGSGDDQAWPLEGLRVLDLADGRGEGCARLLADLGADVVRVEPPGGSTSRRRGACDDGVSLTWVVHNANKRLVGLDVGTDAGQQRVAELAAGADVVIESWRPGRLAELGLAPEQLWATNPSLVVTSITDFGQTGPDRDRIATDEVHLALCGLLSQSGQPGRAPQLPPSNLAGETAEAEAAWATLVACWVAQRSGRGDHVDVSVQEALLDTLDPPFGVQGSATTGLSRRDRRDRPDAAFRYPIIRCADGHIRLCVLSPRQWRGLFEMLGRPERFADPRYEQLVVRYREREDIWTHVAEALAGRTRDDLVASGQALGVPVEAVRRPDEVRTTAHFVERAAFTPVRLPSGATAMVPDGPLFVEGRRAGIRSVPFAPMTGDVDWAAPRLEKVVVEPGARPFTGLRVLDLGVIVVGAETGRLFADQGADVIKVENSSFPDGLRQTLDGAPITANFAAGHRNKRSLGLNLRSDEGRQLFLHLVADADVVVSNFKPGTLESLGLGDAELRAANPEVVTVESSGLGATGPWSRRLGYGPLVRSVTGLTDLWRDPADPDGHFDGVTVYPDHTAARIGALGALALLLQRGWGGPGGAVSLSQAEVVLHQFADHFALASLHDRPFELGAAADAPTGVFACAGDDEWCVVALRSDDQWRALCAAIGAAHLGADPELATAAGRRARRTEIAAHLNDWTSVRDPLVVIDTLHSAGVPAGVMARPEDLEEDPQLTARAFFTTQDQPPLGALRVIRGPARYDRVPPPLVGAAPLANQHTVEVAIGVLGLDAVEVERLVGAGTLEESAS